MTCQYCGQEIPVGSAFCTNCGKPVESILPAEAVNETPAIPLPTAATETSTAPVQGKTSKPKGLLAPLITLIAAVSGWIYIFFSNTIDGIRAWLTSSDDLQNNLSDSYHYFGNNGGQGETSGYIILICVMVFFAILLIIGVVWFIKRLMRRFGFKK